MDATCNSFGTCGCVTRSTGNEEHGSPRNRHFVESQHVGDKVVESLCICRLVVDRIDFNMRSWSVEPGVVVSIVPKVISAFVSLWHKVVYFNVVWKGCGIDFTRQVIEVTTARDCVH